MKFNGEIWMNIPVTQKGKNEPDEFVIVKNKKFGGGLIPYARYGKDWTTTVPNRPLIRELMLLLDKFKLENLDWAIPKSHLDGVIATYESFLDTPGVNTELALQIILQPLAKRYADGERSEELYDAMMAVE